MKTLSVQQFDEFTQGAEVIQQGSRGIKVIKLVDGTYVKLFRLKRLFSSAVIYPQACRFRKNAEKLHKIGIDTIQMIERFNLHEPRRNCVHYEPLAGMSLREYLSKYPEQKKAISESLGKYIALLHKKGVYFRSLHLGNVIVQSDGKLGLIDISDLVVRPWPVGAFKIVRNFRILLRYKKDYGLYDFDILLQRYLASLSGFKSKKDFLETAIRRNYLVEECGQALTASK